MEIDWRTIQFFIDIEDGTAEVMVAALDPNKMRCTCPKFNRLAGCKHVKFMKAKLKATNGVFNLVIPPDVPDEEAMDAMGDMHLFRELVLKYGKPEVL